VCNRCYFFDPSVEFQFPGDSGKLNLISEIQVESSFLCNLDCTACVPISIRNDPENSPLGKGPYNLDPVVFRKLIDNIVARKMHVGEFVFSGRGEPLCNPWFSDLVGYARRRFPKSRFIVHTNGNMPFVKGLMDLDLIVVSLDGAYQGSYEIYRRGGNLKKAFRFIKDITREKEIAISRSRSIWRRNMDRVLRLRRDPYRPQIMWKYVLFDHNDSDDEIIHAQELSKALGVDEMQFVLSHTWNRSRKYTTMDQIRSAPIFKQIVEKRSFHTLVNKDVDNISQWEKENRNRRLRRLLGDIEASIHDGNVDCPFNPIEWYLELSKRCNLRCLICTSIYDDRFKDKRFAGVMSREVFSAVKPYIADSLVVHPVGHGEPFMNPELMRFLKKLKALGPRLSVITNGTLLKGKANALIETRLDQLVVSMDGGEKNIYEYYRAGAKWDSVVKNLEEVCRLKKKLGVTNPEVIIEFVAMRGNLKSLPRLVRLASSKWGASAVAIEALCQVNEKRYYKFYEKENINNVPFEDIEQIFSKATAYAREYGTKLIGPMVDGNRRILWENSRIKPFCCVDFPCSGVTVLDRAVFVGWAFHPKGIREITYRIGSRIQGKAEYGQPRKDVENYFDNAYPGLGNCGFKITTEPSYFDHGINILRLTIMAEDGGLTKVPPIDFVYDAGGSEKQISNPLRFKEVKEKELRLQSSYKLVLDDPSRQARHFPFCTLPWTSTYITFDGHVLPCCYSDQKETYGCVNEESFHKIWNNLKYKKLRTDILDGLIPEYCRSCVSNMRHHGRAIFDKYKASVR